MIDAHAHLTDPRLASDLDAVIARAMAAGIERILSCGEDLPSSERAVELAKRYGAVRAAVGVHPHHATVWSDEVADGLRRLAKDERVVAIGEIGLDFSGRSAPREAQERAFAAQLALAREFDLPIVVHVRDSGDAARAIIDRAPPGTYGMVHCYSEGREQIDGWLGRDFLISFAGPLTYPKNDALRDAATLPPSSALLVETDAPYLAPQSLRGQRNEPANVRETFAALARARGVDPAALGAVIRGNARRLFGARWGEGTS